jgi:hypothetical protein
LGSNWKCPIERPQKYFGHHLRSPKGDVGLEAFFKLKGPKFFENRPPTFLKIWELFKYKKIVDFEKTIPYSY